MFLVIQSKAVINPTLQKIYSLPKTIGALPKKFDRGN
jgi:hypothetical protein